MRENLDTVIGFILEAEGGATITDNPSDPGGLTKYGISQKAFPNLDIRNLTEDEAKEIYREMYWNAVGADSIPWPLDLYVVDTAVNCGVVTAKRLSQTSLNAEDYLLNRIAYYVDISRRNPSLQKFLRGWIIRVMELRKVQPEKPKTTSV